MKASAARVALLTLTAAALGLTGCGGEDPSAAPSSTSAATSSAAPTSSGATTGDSTSAPAPSASTGLDVTEEFTAANPGASWLPLVTSATITEPGRLSVETTIVDPRGGITGSPEAQQAIAICTAAKALQDSLGEPEPRYVSVLESNGTSFVLDGNPAYPGDCVEV